MKESRFATSEVRKDESLTSMVSVIGEMLGKSKTPPNSSTGTKFTGGPRCTTVDSIPSRYEFSSGAYYESP